MKIVVLSGSMRREGNTDLLVQAFVRGAAEKSEVEVISVADYKVNPCIGCNSCAESKGNLCFQKDDMNKIYEKISEADTIILASPVYFCGISAQLKAMVDRLHTPLRNTFKVKKVGLLLVAAVHSLDVFKGIELQCKLALHNFDLEYAGGVFATGVTEKGDIKGNKALDEAYKFGDSI